MLSNDEKIEMLEDGKSMVRKNNFRFTKKIDTVNISFDDYLLFLNDIQKIFSPFEISHRVTLTKINKL